MINTQISFNDLWINSKNNVTSGLSPIRLFAMLFAILFSCGSAGAQNIAPNEYAEVAKRHNEIMTKILNGDQKSKTLDGFIGEEVNRIAGKKIDYTKLDAENTLNKYCSGTLEEGVSKLLTDKKITAAHAAQLRKFGALVTEKGVSDTKAFETSVNKLEKSLLTDKKITADEKHSILMFSSVLKASCALYNEKTATPKNAKGCTDACCKCIKEYKTGLIIADGLGVVAALLSCIAIPEPATCIYRCIYLSTFGSAAYLRKKCKSCF